MDNAFPEDGCGQTGGAVHVLEQKASPALRVPTGQKGSRGSSFLTQDLEGFPPHLRVISESLWVVAVCMATYGFYSLSRLLTVCYCVGLVICAMETSVFSELMQG